MSSMGDDKAVTLQSKDNEVFSVPMEVACPASLIKEMLADTESDVVIPLPNETASCEGLLHKLTHWLRGVQP